MRPVASDADPMTILQAAHFASSRVMAARLEFHRQERLGLFKSLRPMERMTALVRESPFSVRFDWLDAESEFSACVYVENENGGRVALHLRRGLFGGPGIIVEFPPDMAIVFQKAKLPITQFGPRRVMESLMGRIDAAADFGGVRSRYIGRTRVGPAGESCDHVELWFPDGDPHAAKLVDVYLGVQSRLPVMIELWLGSDERREDGKLDARYVFANIEVVPKLDDELFRLD